MVFSVILASLLFVLLFPPSIYYAWAKSKARKAWGLAIDSNYQPRISLIIAAYNEASVIEKKLKNIQEIDYPSDRLEVILVDSASIDGTLTVCRDFLERNSSRFPIKLLSEEERLGKSHALNTALKYVEGEIIATSDADSFWEPDALAKAICFFADPSIGAVTGREELINLGESIYTMSEGTYRKFYYTLRLGESKVHSTLIFQGELSFYRRDALRKFEDRPGYSDDTGTIIDIISRGYRCIFIPEAVFHDTAALSLSGRMKLKSRRAQHLVAGIMQSLRFKIEGRLDIPSKIVLFNFYLHVISPLLLVATTFVTASVIVLYSQSSWYLLLSAIPFIVFKRSRLIMVSYATSNVALIIGLIRHFTGKKETTWRKIEEMRLR